MQFPLVLLAACHGPAPDGGGPEPGSEPTAPGSTPAATDIGPTALRRLTPSAYQNTVRDLFPGVVLPTVTLAADPLVHGFDNNGESQSPSALLVEQLFDGATAIAEAAAAFPSTAFGCPVDGGPDPLACGTTFLTAFGPRVFRRPLAADEQAEAVDLFTTVLAEDGFEVAIQVAVQLWLQAPEFVYLPEIGATGSSGVVPLSGYELASRMSYFLWNTMPDDALFAAAASGALATPEGIEAEALRMLDDPRAVDGIDDFDRLWLTLDLVDAIALDPATYPTFDAAVREAIGLEALWFARRALSEGTLETLLTDRSAELVPETAEVYGVSLPSAGGLVDLPAGERSGVLTRAAFLATRAHAVHPSPVKRGVFVLDRLLCTPPAPPPPDVDTSVPEPSGEPTTNRERYAAHVARPSCAGCHEAIDGIGFGFEHYDSLGMWRDTDGGFPVDATGTFTIGDLDGVPFDGAVEASALLAGSRTVSDCVAEAQVRYALGRSLVTGDGPVLEDLAGGFADAGGRFRDLRIAIVTSDAFRSRRTP